MLFGNYGGCLGGNLEAAVSALSQAQRERLAFLEMRAFFMGELRRIDIETRFGVKPAAVSRDLAAYREIAESNLEYDQVARCYRPTTTFKPVFEFSINRVLSWLSVGFGDGLDLKSRQAAPFDGPGNLVKPDLQVLAVVTRAMCAGRPLRICYLSLLSGRTTRDIVPVALADNGLRWHVRAYDRARKRFSDFVITRIEKAKELPEEAQEYERLGADEQWARIVELELAPHPGLSQPLAIEADYRMQDGVLKIRTRAALAGYVLRRWAVDSTEDHRLDSRTHQLWLRNTPTLYGVHSAVLAPGREDGEKNTEMEKD